MERGTTSEPPLDHVRGAPAAEVPQGELQAELPQTELPQVELPQAGPTDSLVDVPGLRVGQVELGMSEATPSGATGVTIVVAPLGALGAVDVRGAAPGTRETDALSVLSSGERVHAVVLVGRSVFGLAAADGATRELERLGIGLPINGEGVRATIPIVAGAVIFDLRHGDPSVRPTDEAGRRAVAAALDGPLARPSSGNAGAGAGAVTGGISGLPLKGGVGHASLVVPVEGRLLVVGALVVLNSAGSPINPSTGHPWAVTGGFDTPAPVPDLGPIVSARGQTSLVVVGTNAALTKAQLARVAAMAHDGLARAIRPVHSGVDGDAVFALSGAGEDGDAIAVHAWPPAASTIVGSLAADATTRAVLDAIRSARPSGGFHSYVEPSPR